METRLLVILLLILLFFSSSLALPRRRFKRPRADAGFPVVLVPGDGGSRLEANLTGKPSVVHYVCQRITADFFNLWLNRELLGPVVIDCFTDNMKLVFNETSGRTENQPGVDVRVPGFGTDTETVEWLDPSKASSGLYFFNIVDAMVSWGYRRGKDVVGAPFDWRHSPNEQSEYFARLKALIENTYRVNGNKKVVIIAHSMGNPMMLYFYHNLVDQEWKDKFLQSHVALAPPWGGSLQIVRLYASGYNLNYYRIVLAPSKLRDMQRTFMSSALLFPNPNVWGPDEVLASTADHGNYTVADAEKFFTDIAYPQGWKQYQVAGPHTNNLSAPGVQVHCLYGYGVPTPESFTWTKGWFPDYQPYVQNGDGDGTVNRRSAEVCKRWNEGNNSGKRVTVHPVANAEHLAIMSNGDALELVRKAIYGLL